MYNIKTYEDLPINSKLLLNSDQESLEKVFIQLDVDPASLENMMKSVHDWYEKEPHLPKGELHDQFIARLLVMRNFSIEKVKQKIDNYYTVRPRMAEYLSNRDPTESSLNKTFKKGYWIVLPQATPDNSRITIFRMKTSESVIYTDLIKIIFMIDDYRMRNDSVMSEHFILDCTNATLQLAKQMTPVLLSKVIYYVLECLAPKVKGIHIVNLPPFAEMLVTLAKKLMKPKLVKRMHFYKNFDEVLRKFPENIFPKDIGGTDNITCQEIADAWEKTLCSPAWKKFFIEQDSVHTDESKRTLRKNFHDNFGLDGSFKKKQKIDNYYTVRPRMAEYLSNRDPTESSLNKTFKKGYWIVLPQATPDNSRITIFRMKTSESVIYTDLIKIIFMIDDYRMRNDSVMSEHFILDCTNATLQLAKQMTPVLLSKVIYYVLECLGPKVKGIHIVNLPPFAEMLVTLAKKLMKPKLVKRMHFYKNFDEVLRKFPENIFPKDIGGTDNITCQEIADAWEKTLCSPAWKKFFIEQDSVHTDESKRTLRKNFHDNFGLDGSFKKLSID